VALVVIVALAAAACSSDERVDDVGTVAAGGGAPSEVGDTDGGRSGPRSAVGPGISVGEALESDLAGPLLVNGFIVTTSDGTVYLAEALAESLPPQPGGARLVVEGLDLKSFEGLTTAEGITWSDQRVQVLGTVEGDVLTVSTTASA
jgi:hypothetical protein